MSGVNVHEIAFSTSIYVDDERTNERRKEKIMKYRFDIGVDGDRSDNEKFK